MKRKCDNVDKEIFCIEHNPKLVTSAKNSKSTFESICKSITSNSSEKNEYNRIHIKAQRCEDPAEKRSKNRYNSANPHETKERKCQKRCKIDAIQGHRRKSQQIRCRAVPRPLAQICLARNRRLSKRNGHQVNKKLEEVQLSGHRLVQK